MKIKNAQFAMVPTWVALHPEMRKNPTRIAVYVGLRVLAFEHPDKDWHSERDLAEDVTEIVGVGAECVRKHVRAMREAKIILGELGEIELPSDQQTGDQDPHCGDHNPQTGDQDPHALLLSTGKKKDTLSGAEMEADFTEWYSVYPRREARKGALAKYRAARKEATKEQLLDGARRVAALHAGGRALKFIKAPVVWLNQGCWEDEAEVEPDVGGRPAELFAETAQFFTKYASSVPHEKIVATIAALLKNGYGEGETMMRLGVQAALWPEGLAIPNTVMKIPVTVVPRFQGRARQWDDMPDEPYAVLIERAWRGRKWLCQK